MFSQSGASCPTEFCDPDMVSRNRKTHRNMILFLLMGCGVVEITNPSSFSCVLTDSYLAAGGDVQPTGQTLKDVVERWPGGVKTHEVEYMWSCRKADKYGGKNSTVIKTEMQS